MASYITMDLEDKLSLLTQLERAQSLGSVSSQRQGGNVQTDFDTKPSTPEREIQKLIDAILSDPIFTSDHPLWAAMQQGRRGGTTEPIFV